MYGFEWCSCGADMSKVRAGGKHEHGARLRILARRRETGHPSVIRGKGTSAFTDASEGSKDRHDRNSRRFFDRSSRSR